MTCNALFALLSDSIQWADGGGRWTFYEEANK